jgi:uncharacterized protein
MAEIITLVAVLIIGLLAGLVDAIVGSGGLISIPFLIFTGLPAQVAIATDRLGIIGQNLGSIPKFWKEKKIQWKYVPAFSLISIIGAYIGANILLSINEEFLNKVVGVVILLILPFIFIKKDIGVKRKTVTKSKKIIGYFLYLLVMTFAGFIGGGVGILVFYTLMIFFGFTIIEANATDNISWFLLSISSLIIFAMNGLIDYTLGIVLFIGMMVGGYLGVKIVIKKGNQWVKPLFVVVVIISAIKLLFF